MNRHLTKAPFDDERRRLRKKYRPGHPDYHKWRICRWCGKPLPGRRTAWCSSECEHEYKIRAWPSYAAGKVYNRDLGVCAACGLDTREFQKRTRYVWKLQGGWFYEPVDHLRVWARKKIEHWCSQGWPINALNGSRRPWDCDHIHSVVEGGGECGLDNLQTLCIPCHKKKTAELAAKLAQERAKKKGRGIQGELF